MTPFVRNPYNYDMNEASIESGLKCEDKTLAQQQFAEEVDINTIVERFHLTGQIPQLQQLPAFADYEGIFDFQSAMNTIRAAEETFMTLPAKLRARFHNEPQEFLEFCADDNNRDEARKLGILAPEPEITPAHQPQGTPNGTTRTGSTESLQEGGARAAGAGGHAPAAEPTQGSRSSPGSPNQS